MPGTSTIFHIIEILGAFACAHHFWPKGITYSEAEDWEKDHKKRQDKRRRKSSGGRSRGVGGGREERRTVTKRERRDDRYDGYVYDDRLGRERGGRW